MHFNRFRCTTVLITTTTIHDCINYYFHYVSYYVSLTVRMIIVAIYLIIHIHHSKPMHGPWGMDPGPDRFLFNLPSVPDYPGECPLSDVTNGKIFPMYSARSGEQVICFLIRFYFFIYFSPDRASSSILKTVLYQYTHRTHTEHAQNIHRTHTVHTQYTQYTHSTHTVHTQYTHSTHT